MLPYRMTDDGPDLTDRIVYVTVCQDCGWNDDEGYEDKADCNVCKCPACGSEYLVDEEQIEEVMAC
jgi:predicted Zn-ribbon and HTH transcriptional regulator